MFEEHVKSTYFEYVSAIQAGNGQLAAQLNSRFYKLTELSATDIYAKSQEAQQGLLHTP